MQEENFFASIQGVLFSRSVRGCFVSLSLIPLVDDEPAINDPPISVRIQFFDQIKELRSFCRRSYKLGDRMKVQNGKWEELQQHSGEKTSDSWKLPRIVIDVSSSEQIKKHLLIIQRQYWSMFECQGWQNLYIDRTTKQQRKINEPAKQNKKGYDDDDFKANSHGGLTAKRSQGEHIAKFLIASIMNMYYSPEHDGDVRMSWLHDPSKWSQWDERTISASTLYQQAIIFLNTGSGVVDVAGGSGHVSMALGMLGIKSTVVDARESVGKLPGKDRKIWYRALKRSSSKINVPGTDMRYCLPVTPFQSCRAWFGCRPSGVDSTFRHPDQEELPICDETSDLLMKASAIVALHPDEATGDVVRLAVHGRTPIVVVPCCVFARLFPDRKISSHETNSAAVKVVSTYHDLLNFLKGQDPSFMQSELPFDGKNVVLWSTFA